MISENDDDTLKNLIRWNPNYYLNIWVVNSITSIGGGSGVAGYAYLPASHGNDEDGIVNEAAYFGNSPDATKVLIHEAGHYLGPIIPLKGLVATTTAKPMEIKFATRPRSEYRSGRMSAHCQHLQQR
ncbi:MAG: hypothetical protein IPM91_10815 [Bacteroidetes bacterium]|nr:hypothetical protein [Bacteroidota bacterium]